MNARRVSVALGLVVLTGATTGSAQGLGDAAARERERRTKQTEAKKAARSFTNEDLDKGRPPSQPPSGPTASDGSATPAGSSSEMSQPVDDRADSERPQRDAVTAARNQVESIEARIKDLGDKLNPMSGSFIYGSSGSNNANEEVQVREQLRQAEAELADARQNLANATQALEEVTRGRVPIER